MSIALDVRHFLTLPGVFCAGLFMPFTLRLTTLASDKGVVTAIESRALIPSDFVTGATVVSSLSCLTIELRRWPDGYSMRKERLAISNTSLCRIVLRLTACFDGITFLIGVWLAMALPLT